MSQQSACKELHMAFLIDPDIAIWGVKIQSSLFSCRDSIIDLFFILILCSACSRLGDFTNLQHHCIRLSRMS